MEKLYSLLVLQPHDPNVVLRGSKIGGVSKQEIIDMVLKELEQAFYLADISRNHTGGSHYRFLLDVGKPRDKTTRKMDTIEILGKNYDIYYEDYNNEKAAKAVFDGAFVLETGNTFDEAKNKLKHQLTILAKIKVKTDQCGSLSKEDVKKFFDDLKN